MWRAPSSRSRSSSVRDDDGECTPGNGAIPTNAPQRPEVWLDGYPLAEKRHGHGVPTVEEAAAEVLKGVVARCDQARLVKGE